MKTSAASSDTSQAPVEGEALSNRDERLDANLITRQMWALARVSRKRMRWSNHYLAAIGMTLPLVLFSSLFALISIFSQMKMPPLLELFRAFDNMFIGAYLHFALILGGAVFAASTFHEEIDRQTLHHLYLQPIPRWAIPVSRLLGFLMAITPVYIIGFTVSYLLVTLPYALKGQAAEVFSFDRVGSFLTYTWITVLALTIYSTLFLTVSMFVRSIIYAFFFLGWEAGVHLMPALLKNFTVSYYLLDILPVKNVVDRGTISVISEGPGILQSVLALGGLMAFCLVLSSYMATRKQCLYGAGG